MGYALTYNNSASFGTLTVTQAPLTITANNATREFETPNPTFTASYSGFQNNDNPSVVSGLTITTNATINSPVGTYPIVPANGTAQNYSISYVNGILTIVNNNPPPNPTPVFIPNVQVNPAVVTIILNSQLQNNAVPPQKTKKKLKNKPS
jgi:MBG domain (YGX type)